MNPTATVTHDPLPGYVITDRIGSGGYGEVFKATAPGGIEKAVKSLYGYHDEELACRELKALERIKGVRHPFLLSLERFEVVDGRLFVVTELADGSLDDCFQEYRRQGQTGIPRQELISYLRDAADALDYMQDQHGLQHLDVKPENLLIVGGHVKVADFGLVKDVARASQYSQVGGMTPTYAAPELFDNRPGARTDQYSLAIVYQELLTGMLPFPGRTAAQLVAQHTGSEPRVSALPEHDQLVIRQALSKDPEGRFPSCRALIEALSGATGTGAGTFSSGAEEATKESKSIQGDDTNGAPSYVTERMPSHSDSSEQPTAEDQEAEPGLSDSARRWAATERISPMSSQESGEPQASSGSVPECEADKHVPEIQISTAVVDAPLPEIADVPTAVRPTLLIGIGGQAAGVLQRVLRNLLSQNGEPDWQQFVPMLVLDTDRSNLRRVADCTEGNSRTRIETHSMPLKLPQHYRSSAEILQWLSRRWFYNIPRSLKTGGFRPLGRLALVDNSESVIQCIEEKIERMADRERLESSSFASNINCDFDKPRVILVASTSGGTGSGTVLDLAWAVRHTVEAREGENWEVLGVFGDCSTGSGDARDLALVNTLAFLREFSSMGRQGNRNEETHHERTALFEGDSLPLDHTYYVSGMRGETPLSVEQWIEQTAEYLTTDIASGCGPLLDACRAQSEGENPAIEESDQVRSFVVAPLNERREIVTRMAQEKLCAMVAAHWRRRSSSGSTQEAPVKSRARAAKPIAAETLSPSGEQPESQVQDMDPVECLIEATRSEFGAANDSVFATQLVAELRVKLRILTERLHRDSDHASEYYVHRLVHHAFEDLTAVVCRFAADGPDGEVMSARCMKATDQNTEPPDVSVPNDQLSALVDDIAQQASGSYFAALVEAPKPSELDLREFLLHTTGRALEELSDSEAGDLLLEQLASCQANTSLIIENTVVGPPGCGHLRRTMVVVPEKGIEPCLEEEIRTQLPDARFVRANVSRPLLIREAANLSISQIASRFVEDRPDLVEASRRLQTRNDLACLPLPQVISVEANL